MDESSTIPINSSTSDGNVGQSSRSGTFQDGVQSNAEILGYINL
jgi:hypothetical protein